MARKNSDIFGPVDDYMRHNYNKNRRVNSDTTGKSDDVAASTTDRN